MLGWSFASLRSDPKRSRAQTRPPGASNRLLGFILSAISLVLLGLLAVLASVRRQEHADLAGSALIVAACLGLFVGMWLMCRRPSHASAGPLQERRSSGRD